MISMATNMSARALFHTLSRLVASRNQSDPFVLRMLQMESKQDSATNAQTSSSTTNVSTSTLQQSADAATMSECDSKDSPSSFPGLVDIKPTDCDVYEHETLGIGGFSTVKNATINSTAKMCW